MFEQALDVADQLPASRRNSLIARLDRVRAISHNFGYGVGDDMDSLLAKYIRSLTIHPSGSLPLRTVAESSLWF